jgi:hypothetical protein
MRNNQPTPASEMSAKDLLREWKCVDRHTDAGSRNYELAREMVRRKIDV